VKLRMVSNRMDDHSDALRRVLDPADNATGGGAAAAIAGAMAAALTGMVARLSAGRAQVEPDTFYHALAAAAEGLTPALLGGADEDARAFAAVGAAYRLPRGTETDKAARSRAVQDALVHASRVPLVNAGHCKRVLELCGQLRGRSNPNVASDLECARLLARAALLGCLANVEANVCSIRDEAQRADLTRRVARLRETGELAQ
jgi:formiminotetrahydrofolate cyclodeaminase